ncbi:MAG: hypothetical protein MPW15_21685 [Candidatus Manganitrophus sp.]|nr:hypothetical protein [Candidatus Manganitrophus sp.]
MIVKTFLFPELVAKPSPQMQCEELGENGRRRRAHKLKVAEIQITQKIRGDKRPGDLHGKMDQGGEENKSAEIGLSSVS